MKHFSTKLLFALMLLYTPFFYAQSLEIHTVNVGHGDCALILIRDTVKMKAAITKAGKTLPLNNISLLDTMQKYDIPLAGTVLKSIMIDYGNGSSQGNKITDYLDDMGVDKLNYVFLSHNHQDHYGGFKTMIETNLVEADTAVYRGNTSPAGSPGFTTGFLNVCNKAKIKFKIIDVATGEVNFGTINGVPVKLIAVTSNGYVFRDNAHKKRLGKSSQNDFGVSWILQYGGFRYFTGGDISGYSVSNYVDVETSLADSLKKHDPAVFKSWDNVTTLGKGHVCAMKVNHHGSKHSSNSAFLGTLNPATAFISCGKSHGHPNFEVIDGLLKLASLQKYFITSLQKFKDKTRADIGKPLNKGVIGGNIVLIVVDTDIATQSEFHVLWDGELDGNVVSDKSAMRAPNTAGAIDFPCHKVQTAGHFTH